MIQAQKLINLIPFIKRMMLSMKHHHIIPISCLPQLFFNGGINCSVLSYSFFASFLHLHLVVYTTQTVLQLLMKNLSLLRCHLLYFFLQRYLIFHIFKLQMIKKLLLILFGTLCISSLPLAQYYCGFSGTFCGQSTTDDTNAKASLIILAFANIMPNGTVVMDTQNYPCTLVQTWQSQGKKVFLSIGGASGTWTSIFTPNGTAIAVASIISILDSTTLDGIDLDLQQYAASINSVNFFISQLKSHMKGKYLSVAPQCVGVYQGQPIPSTNMTNPGYWNYWVPIINSSDQYIDLYLVQAYNNWYDGLVAGSFNFIEDVYLQWSNLPSSYCQGCSPIPNFHGVNSSKLVILLPASATAGSSPATTAVIQQFINSTSAHGLKGMGLWDSHWDALNSYSASNAIITGTSPNPLPPTPPPPACNDTQPPNPPIPKSLKMQ